MTAILIGCIIKVTSDEGQHFDNFTSQQRKGNNKMTYKAVFFKKNAECYHIDRCALENQTEDEALVAINHFFNGTDWTLKKLDLNWLMFNFNEMNVNETREKFTFYKVSNYDRILESVLIVSYINESVKVEYYEY